MPGWSEILIIAFVGLLLFGRRLPEVGRSLGKSIVEFKRGVRDVEGELESAS
ncbi:MAG: Sec-independent protein translocase subunit TatA/TatB, partial [Planctomycetota bacterium]